jgi:hypothetical protein
MIKTQLNPFHRLYTIKLALDALLLYGKSGFTIISFPKNEVLRLEKRFEIFSIGYPPFLIPGSILRD